MSGEKKLEKSDFIEFCSTKIQGFWLKSS